MLGFASRKSTMSETQPDPFQHLSFPSDHVEPDLGSGNSFPASNKSKGILQLINSLNIVC